MKELSKKKIILYCLGTLTFLIVGIFLTSNTFYSFTVGSKMEQLSIRGLNNEQEILKIGSVYIIPKSISSIVISSNNQQTQLALTERPFIGYENEQVVLQPQKEVIKIGSNGLGCDFQNGNEFYSYDCSGSNKDTLKYTSDVFNNALISNSIPSDSKSSTVYQSGFLSLTGEGSSASVVYSTPDGQVTASTSLEKETDTNSAAIILNSNSKAFAVVDQKNKRVFAFNSIESKPTILTSKNIPDGQLSACDYRRSNLVCIVTSYKHANDHQNNSEENHIDIDDANVEKVIMVEYDIASKKITQNTLPIKTVFDTFCIDDDGTSYALSENYSLYTIVNNKVVLMNNDVRELSCGAKNYYSTDKSVYKINKNQASLSFTSKKLSLSQLNNTTQGMFFSAIGVDGILHSYLLSDQSLKSQRREDYLPLPTILEALPIDSIDYRGDRIFIKPTVEITSDHQAGTTTINSDEFEIAKTKISNYLKTHLKGIDYSVIYINPLD